MAGLSRAPGVTGALKQLNDELHILHARAGQPSVRDMARACCCGPNLIQKVFSAPRIPKLPLLLGIVEFLAKYDRRANPETECDRFDALWEAAMAEEVPDLFPPQDTDSDDEEGFGPSSGGRRPTPPEPVKPTGGGANTPPADDEVAASPIDDSRHPMPDSFREASRVLFVGVDEYPTAGAAQVVRRDLTPAKQLAGIFHDLDGQTSSPSDDLLWNPTRERFWSSLVDAASLAREKLVIYYFGHGIRDASTSEVYLAAADTITEDEFTVNAISVRDIRYLLASSPVKQLIVIVDACFDDRSELRTTVLPTRPSPEEPYNLRPDSLRRRTFVLANSVQAGPNVAAFSSGLVRILAATGSGKTMSLIHSQLTQLAEAQHWRGLRMAHVNDGDQILLDDLRRDRGTGLPQRLRPRGLVPASVGAIPSQLSIWHFDDRLRLDARFTPPSAASMSALTAVNKAGSDLSVVTVSDHRVVQFWSVRDGVLTPDVDSGWEQPPPQRVEAIAWAATDNRTVLLTSASDGIVKLWDSAEGSWVDAMPAADTASVAAIAAVALSDGRVVLGAVRDGKSVLLFVTHGAANQHISRMQFDDDISSMAMMARSGGTASVLVGHTTGSFTVRDLDADHPSAVLNTGQPGPITAIAAASKSDGQTIVATADDTGTVQFWDLTTLNAIGEPIQHASGKVMLAGVSVADGVRFVVGTP